MSQNQQGFTHLLAILVVGLGAGLFISSLIPVSRHYNDGKSAVAGVYLAKGGDDSSGSSGGGSSSGSGGGSGSHDSGSSGGSGSSGSGSSGSSGGGNSSGGSSGGGSAGSNATKTIVVPTQIAPKIEKVETKLETKTPDLRVETETTLDRIKSDIRQGNLRVKFEIKNGEVEVETKVKEAENETELESGAENEAVREVEAELEKADLKIATAPGQIALVNKGVGALTNFPLSVDPTTRQLTVTTPKGVKVVTVLPQKAVDNMLAAHIMDDVVGEKVNNSLASIPNLVKLETRNGVLGFDIKGTKTHKLLGFIPIKTGVEAFVSAENGQVVETNESFLAKILNRIAP